MAQGHEPSASFSSSSMRDTGNSNVNPNLNLNPNLYQAASPIPIPIPIPIPTTTTTTTTAPSTTSISYAIMQSEHYYKQQVKQVRELWMLREQARVQAVERKFLSRLHHLVERAVKRSHGSDSQDHMLHLGDAASGTANEHDRSVSSFLLNDSSWIFEENRNENENENGNGANEMGDNNRQEQRQNENQNPWHALLEEEQHVTHALESEFRHHLERVLVEQRSGVEQGRRVHPYYQRLHEANQVHSVIREEDDYERQFQAVERGNAGPSSSHSSGAVDSSGIRNLEHTVLELQREIGVLKNVINASFDVQLDIQRSIRQELAAALYSYNMDKNDTPSLNLRFKPVRNQPRRRGCCAICIETSVDCVLYMCGHYCVCSSCARSLLSSGLPCPICRAPIRDVIQVYDTIDDHGAGRSSLGDNLSTSLVSPGTSL